MSLSSRARNYFNSLEKNLALSSDREITEQYLIKNNLKPTNELLNFQEIYSGIDLIIRKDKGHGFSTFLFSKNQIISNEPIEINKVADKFYFDCGMHDTAQFNFYLSHLGEFCTIDNYGVPNTLNSSFEKVIEGYALKNEIYDWAQNPVYFQVKNSAELIEKMNVEFEIIEECSDEYTIWWKSGDLIIERGIWLDKPDYYFHVYGKTEKQCDLLIERLKSAQII